MPNRSQLDIYRIDNDIVLNDLSTCVDTDILENLSEISRKMKENKDVAEEQVDIITTEFCKFIIDTQNAKERVIHFFEVQLNTPVVGGYHLKLFQAENDPKSALEKIIEPYVDNALLKGKNISYILFLCNKTQLFAFCSGAGWQVVVPYIDYMFGMRVMSRLISESEQAINGVKYRGFTGMLAAQQNNYRKRMRTSDISDFGKFFQDVAGQISIDRASQVLGVVPYSRHATVLKADFKSGFRVRRSLNLVEYCELLNRLSALLCVRPYYEVEDLLGMVIVGNNTKDKRLKKELESLLIGRVYEYAQGERWLDLFVCNSDIINYQSATSYELIGDGFSRSYQSFMDDHDLLLLVNDMLNVYNGPAEKRESAFSSRFKLLHLNAYNGLAQVTTGKLMDQLQADIIHGDRNYMFLDGRWYNIQDKMKFRLNAEIPSLVRSYNSTLKLPVWTTGSEDNYLSILQNEYGHIKMHLKKPLDNIEFCDSIYFDEKGNKLYICHAKDDFDTKTRVLCAQVQSSASLITDIIANGRHEDLKKALIKEGIIPNKISWKTIKAALNREIDIVECIILRSDIDLVNDVAKYGSTIAKFELSYLFKSWNYSFALQIAQGKG